jgi:hypothetical protein
MRWPGSSLAGRASQCLNTSAVGSGSQRLAPNLSLILYRGVSNSARSLHPTGSLSTISRPSIPSPHCLINGKREYGLPLQRSTRRVSRPRNGTPGLLAGRSADLQVFLLKHPDAASEPSSGSNSSPLPSAAPSAASWASPAQPLESPLAHRELPGGQLLAIGSRPWAVLREDSALAGEDAMTHS